MVGDFTEQQRERTGVCPQIHFVNVEITTDWLGHGYVISNPAMLSDLIKVLRDRSLPGAEHGRPEVSSGDWIGITRSSRSECAPHPRRG